MVRSTEGLQTSVGRSLQGTFRPYRATWHRRHKDEDPRESCKVRLDRMVNAGRIPQGRHPSQAVAGFTVVL